MRVSSGPSQDAYIDMISRRADEAISFLDAIGEMTMTTLRKKMEINESLFDQVIGWLACEGKIEIQKQGRFYKVFSKDHRP